MRDYNDKYYLIPNLYCLDPSKNLPYKFRIPVTFKYFGYDLSESGTIERGTHVEYIYRNTFTINSEFAAGVWIELKAYPGPNH